MIMNDLPLHLIDEILLRLEPKSLAMMRCTNKSIKSYLTDPIFGPEYPSWVRPSLFDLSSIGANYVFWQPLVSSCDSISFAKCAAPYIGCNVLHEPCYIFGSCSGLLLLYIGCLFVANPITKRFRILNHSGSKLIPNIVGGDNIMGKDASYPEGNVARTERAMCVGFTVNRNRTTKRFKIVCILEMETVYGFEISDGDSWRLSETTLTTSSQSDLTTRMKPVYLDDTLHWLRNDGSIIAFNPETEQARLIPSRFHRKPDMKLLFAEDEINGGLTLISGTNETLISVYTLVGNHKWELKRRINNVSTELKELALFSLYTLVRNHEWALMRRINNVSTEELALLSKEKREPVSWNIVAYDGKCLVVREVTKGLESLEGVVYVYDMEANSWGVLGFSPSWSGCVRDYYKFTPSLFFVEEDEQQKVIVASNDRRISHLTMIMGLIDTIK